MRTPKIVAEFADAADAYAFRGAADPAYVEEIEQRYEAAKGALVRELARLRRDQRDLRAAIARML